MSILIKDVVLAGQTVDVLVEGNIIRQVGAPVCGTADRVIDGAGRAVFPGFVNGHTHAAMTLFRGTGDGVPLEVWLREKVWPAEARLTPDEVYWGVRLACLEMIKSGTTCFNDMYRWYPQTLRAVEEMGLRAVLGPALFDFPVDGAAAETARELEAFLALPRSARIGVSVAPHAIYTVSGAALQWANDFARANGLPLHLHLAETQVEYQYSVRHFGVSPVRYLHRLGLLSPRLLLAHGLWIDDEEIALLAAHGVGVVHNPNSNMKLASGYRFKYEELKAAGVAVGIGTDGCGSSNNLDVLEAAKTASLLQKAWRGNPLSMPAHEALQAITATGAELLGIRSGKIAAGYLADLLLVNTNTPAFTPNCDPVSNLIYAAHSDCIDTVICDGNILMENRCVPGEAEILARATEAARRLIKS